MWLRCEYSVKGCVYTSVQKLEDEFRASREEQEQLLSLDKPLPKQMRLSLFLPGAVGRGDRTSSRLSSTSPTPSASSLNMASATNSIGISGLAQEPQVEVVLNTSPSPPPNEDSPTSDPNST